MISRPCQFDLPQATMPLLLLLFFGSGFSALVYEVVWFQMLRLSVGSSQLSVSILLISFMSGLYLGSLLFHRFIGTRHHPLRVLAVLELAIGFCGLLILGILPIVSHVYLSAVGYGWSSILFRSLVCMLVLLPPTVLMGATLPAISRWTESDSSGSAKIAALYGCNILGAVVGTLLTGFYLLRYFDVYVASGAAISINALIAAVAFHLARRSSDREAPAYNGPTTETFTSRWPVSVAVALSGFTALGAQIIWIRLLSMRFGATVYTFVVVLAIFLAGLALGSMFASILIRRTKHSLIPLAMCQALLIPAIAFAAFAILQQSGFANEILTEVDTVNHRFSDITQIAIALLPATLLWGASFPLAVAATVSKADDPGQVVGRLYALNALGAVSGVAIVSAVLMPFAGSGITQHVLVLLSAVSFMSLWFGMNLSKPQTSVLRATRRQHFAGVLVVALIGIVLILSMRLISPPDPGLIGYGREVARWKGEYDYLHVAEGMNTSIAVSQRRDTGYRSFHIGGKVVASTLPEDMRLQRLLGHMPALVHENPKSVLIVGLGAGVTAGTFVLHDNIERIVIVEIEREVAFAAREYFGDYNNNVLDDPRTEIIFDDARHFLATTRERFDIITADPVHPWVKGSAALYTKEFFELCKDHLTEGGLITQWVPLYETSAAAVKSEIGTFFEVFPDGSIWNSQKEARGYDVYLMAGTDSVMIDVSHIERRLVSAERLRASLAEVRVESALDMLKTFAGQEEHISGWITGYEVNLDRNLRLEYLAGDALNTREEQDLYAEMTAELSYPTDLFDIDGEEADMLRSWFGSRYGRD